MRSVGLACISLPGENRGGTTSFSFLPLPAFLAGSPAGADQMRINLSRILFQRESKGEIR